MRVRRAAALTAAGVAAGGLTVMARGSAGKAAHWPPKGPEPDEGRGYPVVIHRLDGFLTLHAASFAAVRATLPTDLLHPLRWPNGRAIVAVAFLQKRAITAGSGDAVAALPPYAELMVGAIVARRPLSPIESALAMLRLDPALGTFPIQFPLTSRVWRDLGRSEVGMPMFIADVAVDLSNPGAWRVRITEDERPIVEVVVAGGGPLRETRQSMTFYGALDGELLSARSETRFVGRWRGDGTTLRLGTTHPAGIALRELDIGSRGLASFTYASGDGVLHRPSRIGAARAYPCHPGLDVTAGRYTVRYPGTGPIEEPRVTELDEVAAALASFG